MSFGPVTKTKVIVILSCILVALGTFVFFFQKQKNFEDVNVFKNNFVNSLSKSVVSPNSSKLIRLKSPGKSEDFYYKLAYAASSLTDRNVIYDASYVQIKYPGGDVPKNRGVCTDMVIRAYRKLGIDLQVDVHKDMTKNFNLYPKSFGLSKPDTNIDHRRVPNLMTFFKRKGNNLPITQKYEDYSPGDIVSVDFGGGLKHVAIVSAYKLRGTNRLLMVHNGGYGQVMEDALFRWKIIGHYRYSGTRNIGT